MLKVLQVRFQQYVNWKFPGVQAEFRKGRGIRDQIVNIHWISKKLREFQKNISVQLSRWVVSDSATPWNAALQVSLSIINSWSLLKLMCIKLVMPSNPLILSRPLLLPLIFPSIRVFSNESVLHIRWPKYGSFSISPSNEYSKLISFRIDWFDLLVVQGTLKSLFWHHSSTTTSALLGMPKPLTKPWKILQDMGIPDHLTCLLRNLNAAQEATVRTEHGTTDWLQIGNGLHQGGILSPCLCNLYAEYIMRSARLDEAQAGSKIARRNINNLR